MKLISKLAAASALALSMAVVAAPANSAVFISLDGVTDLVTLPDGGISTGNLCSILGANCGGFETVSVTGSAPPSRPGLLHTNAVEVNTGNTGSASVTVWVTRTGLAPLGLKQYLSFSNNNQGGPISTVLTQFVSSSNAKYGGTQLGAAFTSNNLNGSNSNNQTTFVDLSAPGTYSLTQKYVITAAGARNERSASPTMTASVPEPGTWALMIMGFGGAGAMIRSRRKVLAAV